MRDAHQTTRLSQRIAERPDQPNPPQEPQPRASTDSREDDPRRSDTRIFKHRPLRDFTIVSNSIAQSRLSLAAKGLMLYFLSLPDTWEIVMPNVQKAVGIGRTALRTIFKELQEAGHMRFIPTHWDNGKMVGNRWHVYADPMENPSLEVGGQPVRNQPVFIKKEDKETIKDTEKERVSVPSLRSETTTKSLSINDSNPQNSSGPAKPEKKEKSASVAPRPPAPRLRLIPPTREAFDAYIEENCPHLYDKGINSFDQLQEDNWHEWKRGRWNPINYWQAWVDGTERTVRNSTFGENR